MQKLPVQPKWSWLVDFIGPFSPQSLFRCSLRSKDSGVSSPEGVQLQYIGSIPLPFGGGGRGVEQGAQKQGCRQTAAGALGVRGGAYCVLEAPRPHRPSFWPKAVAALRGGSLPGLQELVFFMVFTSPPGVRTANYMRRRCVGSPRGTKGLRPSDPADSRLPLRERPAPSCPGSQPAHDLVPVRGRSARRGPRGAALLRGCGGVGNTIPLTLGLEKVTVWTEQVSCGILVSTEPEGGQRVTGLRTIDTGLRGWPVCPAVSSRVLRFWFRSAGPRVIPQSVSLHVPL